MEKKNKVLQKCFSCCCNIFLPFDDSLGNKKNKEDYIEKDGKEIKQSEDIE
jgi:hypothetical protein